MTVTTVSIERDAIVGALRPGDLIVSVDGEPLAEPLMVEEPDRVRRVVVVAHVVGLVSGDPKQEQNLNPLMLREGIQVERSLTTHVIEEAGESDGASPAPAAPAPAAPAPPDGVPTQGPPVRSAGGPPTPVRRPRAHMSEREEAALRRNDGYLAVLERLEPHYPDGIDMSGYGGQVGRIERVYHWVKTAKRSGLTKITPHGRAVLRAVHQKQAEGDW